MCGSVPAATTRVRTVRCRQRSRVPNFGERREDSVRCSGDICEDECIQHRPVTGKRKCEVRPGEARVPCERESRPTVVGMASHCGAANDPDSSERFRCAACGARVDHDLNAALNILRVRIPTLADREAGRLPGRPALCVRWFLGSGARQNPQPGRAWRPRCPGSGCPAAMARADLTVLYETTPIPTGGTGRSRSSGTGPGGSQRTFPAGRARLSLRRTVIDSVSGPPESGRIVRSRLQGA